MVARVAALALLIIGMSPGSPIVWTNPGEIRVVVVDRDSLPIVGVTVALTVATGSPRQVVVTDTKGRAGFDHVKAGDYMLRFDLSGFAPCSIGPITMRADRDGNTELPEFLVMLNPVKVS